MRMLSNAGPNGERKWITWEQWCYDNVFEYPILEDCKGYPFNMARIYPIKQREVRDVYLYLKDHPKVARARVFGSSTNMKCDWDSDLDVCIKVTTECTEWDRGEISAHIVNMCKNGADVLWWDDIKYGTELYANIRRGVILF